MKSALNGGLNLSIKDGWWDEWFDGQNGWAIPTADGVEDAERRDDVEAAAIYDLLDKQVLPRFYETDRDGVPTRWVEMVKHTLKDLGPKVLASRMVADYVHQLYVPAAGSARLLAEGGYQVAREQAAGARTCSATGAGCGSPTSRPPGWATPPRSARRSTCVPRWSCRAW